MNMINKLITLLKEDGAAYLLYKVKKKLQVRFGFKRQETSFAFEPASTDVKFSIVVPLFNTPEQLLREMMDSVVFQSYPNWELCMADGSDDAHSYVGNVVQEYAQRDGRFKYRKLRENLGISGNTNACIEMSSGDYIALFDHDDLLHPHALQEVARVIYHEGADFIYTDETMFYKSPADAYSPHYKPDFAPDTLRSYNYITHLSVFSRALMDKVGLFRSEFDGSQDYDMILRLTEQAERIVHIPKILYYWRNHPGSVASDVAVKPYTMVSARKALAEHLERMGIKGSVEDSAVPTTYRIRYEIEKAPLVSVVVADGQGRDRTIDSVRKKTSYKNYEIVRESEAKGDYLVFLHADTEVLTSDWIESLLMYAQRKDVGAVGCMVWYADDTVCSAGKIIGIRGTVGDSHPRFPKGHDGYKFRLTLAQNYSAVSSKCMMTRRELWNRYNSFDSAFDSMADVWFCLYLRNAGYLNVWTPYAEVRTNQKFRKQGREQIIRFRKTWKNVLGQGDPYYNPNLTLLRGDFGEK